MKDVCYRCNQSGHKKSECTKGMTCYSCGGRGHFMTKCPRSQSKTEDEHVINYKKKEAFLQSAISSVEEQEYIDSFNLTREEKKFLKYHLEHGCEVKKVTSSKNILSEINTSTTSLSQEINDENFTINSEIESKPSRQEKKRGIIFIPRGMDLKGKNSTNSTNSTNCYNCNQVGHLKKDCSMSNNVKSSGDSAMKKKDKIIKSVEKTCYECGKVGHLKDTCPEKKPEKTCYECGQVGHFKDTCPEKTCYSCGKVGHFKDTCPEKKTEKKHEKICYTCGKTGHLKDTCPEKKTEKDTKRKVKLSNHHKPSGVVLNIYSSSNTLSGSLVTTSMSNVKCDICGDFGHIEQYCAYDMIA